jgi:TPP-dependent 2-oxoacid decarboxylase
MSFSADDRTRTRQTLYESLVIRDTAELDKLLADKEFGKPNKLRLVELVLPINDVPPFMRRVMAKLPQPAK